MGHEVVERRMRGEADLIAVLRLARLFRRLRPDVVHLHTSHAHSLGRLAAKFGGRPAVVVSRRVDFSIFRRSFFGLNGLKYRSGVDRFVAVSAAVKHVLECDGLDPARIAVVRDAIDPDRVRKATPVDVRARLGLAGSARIVLAVGALVGHKGQRHLVAAIPAIVADEPNAHVVIAGEGKLHDDLAALASALGVTKRLSLPGYVTDVAGWFAAADVFVMPSVEEGLGSSVLDAMAAGVPIVATTAGGIPEAVRDGVDGLLVPPGDAAALARGIVSLLRDRYRAHALAAEASKRVETEFAVDRMVDETIAVYRAVLSERESA
jgi:glycosyltransferase involved in cell wall biosynthesis